MVRVYLTRVYGTAIVAHQARGGVWGGNVGISWSVWVSFDIETHPSRLHVPLASWQSLESARLVDSNPSTLAILCVFFSSAKLHVFGVLELLLTAVLNMTSAPA